jgi:hypothetical protein
MKDWMKEDLAFGQYLVVTARWILVAAGFILTVWVTGQDTPQVRQQVVYSFVVLAALAFGNFLLNMQLLKKRPTLDVVAYAASAADLVVITILIAVQGGFSSNVYVFYFPALLAISVAFPRPAAVVYTAAAMFAYWSVCLPLVAASDQQTMVTRLVMLAAVAFCGQLYFQIESDRRRDAQRANEAVTATLGQR